MIDGNCRQTDGACSLFKNEAAIFVKKCELGRISLPFVPRRVSESECGSADKKSDKTGIDRNCKVLTKAVSLAEATSRKSTKDKKCDRENLWFILCFVLTSRNL